MTKHLNAKKKICLIYTGGTIGMIADEKGELGPPTNPNDFLSLAPELSEIAEFDFVPLMNKDSTNVVPRDWTKMAHCVYERLQSNLYDGFVIVHGTDTMHFSSSALSFALGPNLNCPVVLTGAQTIPEIKHGDARINLLRAVKVACQDLAEVVISFGDFVFRGCRTQKKDERKFDAFESPALFPIADITEEILLNPLAKRKSNDVELMELQPEFAEGIIQLGLIPGLIPSALEPLLDQKSCSGIVLQSFGAGNVPDWEEYGFQEFIVKATKRGVPIVITSQFPANSTLNSHYGPGLRAIEAGAIPTGNMTSAAATVKFRWALARARNNQENTLSSSQFVELRKLMAVPYVDEMD